MTTKLIIAVTLAAALLGCGKSDECLKVEETCAKCKDALIPIKPSCDALIDHDDANACAAYQPTIDACIDGEFTGAGGGVSSSGVGVSVGVGGAASTGAGGAGGASAGNSSSAMSSSATGTMTTM